LDARDGYREGVRTQGGSRQIFVQQNARAPLVVRPLPPDADGVIDAGFDAFIRARWRDFSAGQSRRIPFLVPDHFKFMDFRIAESADGTLAGRPVRELKMSLNAWYGFALPSIDLAYDPDGQRLQEYQGIGTIRDGFGKNQNVRIEFPADARREPVSDEEIERAAALPLSASCRS
jgi:hypothetical protein